MGGRGAVADFKTLCVAVLSTRTTQARPADPPRASWNYLKKLLLFAMASRCSGGVGPLDTQPCKGGIMPARYVSPQLFCFRI